jgi:hypothetical protein
MRRKGAFLQPIHRLACAQMGAEKEAGMSTCERTGLSIPECACRGCIERQLAQFAPEMAALRRRHEPLLLPQAPDAPRLPPAPERERPAA